MRRSFAVLLLAASLLAGCATDQAFLEGKQLLSEGRIEEGLARLEQAVNESPGNAEYRAYLHGQRERMINQMLAQADSARLNAQFDDAEAVYRRALRLDPRNQRVMAGLEGVALDRRHKALTDEAQGAFQKGDAAAAESSLRTVLAENPKQREAKALMRRIEEKRAGDPTVSPRLKSALAKPITLEFRDAGLRAVFEVISRTAGINFTFDKDVRPDLKATIFVKDTSIEDAIQILLLTNQLDRKILNENTLLIYPNTAAKQRDYQELMVKSFYLANADVKQTVNMIRAMLKTRDLFIDEKVNLIVMRDTPEAVRLAEKLIAAQDLAEPEAVLEVEVLEVNRGRLQELGLRWPEQIGYGLLQGGTTSANIIVDPITGLPTTVTNTTAGSTVAPGVIDLHNRGGLTSFVTNPLLLLNLKAQDSNANVLANPRIRVKNREKAKIHIGDKVPVFTSTAVINAGIAQSVTYLDVGVKLEVEPNIGLEDEVTMKVGLEVSSITERVAFGNSVAFRVGTRSAGTVLRLRDGETQMLAGLIQDEDRRTVSKVPGLGDLPVLGRLFSSHSDDTKKTEIVLLITPRVVRNLTLPEAGATGFAAGTESGVGRLGARSEGAAVPLPAVAPPSPAPAPARPPAQPAPAPTLVPVPGILPPGGAPPGSTGPAAPGAPN